MGNIRQRIAPPFQPHPTLPCCRRGELHRQRSKRGHRHHRPVQRERDALRQRHREAHAGERTRPATDGDGVELRTRDAGVGQQLSGPRQREFRVLSRRDAEAFAHLAVDPQRDGTGFGGGFDGEQLHAVDAAARKDSTSARLRAIGSGGSESRNTRP